MYVRGVTGYRTPSRAGGIDILCRTVQEKVVCRCDLSNYRCMISKMYIRWQVLSSHSYRVFPGMPATM